MAAHTQQSWSLWWLYELYSRDKTCQLHAFCMPVFWPLSYVPQGVTWTPTTGVLNHSHSRAPSARHSSWTCCMCNPEYQVIKSRVKWKVHTVLYILSVFILDKYVPMHTWACTFKKELFALPLNGFQIFVFHILAQHSSQVRQDPTEISLSVNHLIMSYT